MQNSIKDSVHKLLTDQISLLGLGGFYSVFEQVIKGVNGTEFIFSGLSNQTVESIKSFEGIDRCWCEEAQNISKRSWDILIPTIRKDESEIWISYNPDLETDETHQRFTVHPPEDTVNVEVNWCDNPWWNSVLESERLRCKEHDPDNYENIWEGKCRPAVEGAIYYKEIQAAEAQNRICHLPYDSMLRVHVVLDLGWNDAMAIGLVQKHHSSVRIIRYIEDSHRTIDDYSAQLRQLNYNWGKVWLPHDGFTGDAKTGKSFEAILKTLRWSVARKDEVTILPVENGIKAAKMMFPRVLFDKDNAEGLVERLKRYRRRVSRQTNEPGSPLHDENSHGADLFRYICLNADSMHNEDEKPLPFKNINYTPTVGSMGY